MCLQFLLLKKLSYYPRYRCRHLALLTSFGAQICTVLILEWSLGIRVLQTRGIDVEIRFSDINCVDPDHNQWADYFIFIFHMWDGGETSWLCGKSELVHEITEQVIEQTVLIKWSIKSIIINKINQSVDMSNRSTTLWFDLQTIGIIGCLVIF